MHMLDHRTAARFFSRSRKESNFSYGKKKRDGDGTTIPLGASCTQPIQIDTDDQLVFARHYFLNYK